MVNNLLKVVIDKDARKSRYQLYHYIKQESLQNAEKVKIKILLSFEALPKTPFKHNPDK
jgi:hypothetical protein